MKQLSDILPSSKGRGASNAKNARIISQAEVLKGLISRNYSPQVCAAILTGLYNPKIPYSFLPRDPLPADQAGEAA